MNLIFQQDYKNNFVSLQDGCNLVFRSDDLSEPRQYRGITGDNLPDNQDMERGTSDRDDQMLNM